MPRSNIERVHDLANLLVYDLEISGSVRHPVRFFQVADILRAVGATESQLSDYEATKPSFQVKSSGQHSSTCECRFCTTGLFDTRLLKTPP